MQSGKTGVLHPNNKLKEMEIKLYKNIKDQMINEKYRNI
jgi:hypothetical protein